MQSSSLEAMFAPLRAALARMPDWLAGVVALAIAALAAFVLYQLIFVLLRGLVGERRPFLRSLLQRTRALGAFALVAFALASTALWAPFDPDVRRVLAHALAICFIA